MLLISLELSHGINRQLAVQNNNKNGNKNCHFFRSEVRLASVDILGKERAELVVGKLDWHGNFDTGFERNTSRSKSRVRGTTWSYDFQHN